LTDDSYDNAAPSAPGDISIITIEDELKRSYLDYAMSVIVSRALPDARDGLKPVHRRILYSMHDLNMTPERSYSKCARVVGDVLGRFHPHGDASVYMALVRMAQPFSMGLMLVDGQGNFGSVDGDMPASMRYTEARMAPAAVALLTDIEKDTVDFQPTTTRRSWSPSSCRRGFPTCWSTARAASPSAWRPTSRRTTWVKSSMRPWRCWTTPTWATRPCWT